MAQPPKNKGLKANNPDETPKTGDTPNPDETPKTGDTPPQTSDLEGSTNDPQKPDDPQKTKDTKGGGKNKVSKGFPERVKARVTKGYTFFHPYASTTVTSELKEFNCDKWLIAQLRAGFVELYTINNKPLILVDDELVEQE